MSTRVTVVIPACNEALSLQQLLPAIRLHMPHARLLVVDDGSSDDTVCVADRHGADVLRHPYTKGNGASVKTGIRDAKTDFIVLMDADSQHDPADIPNLMTRLLSGYDMVIGARGWSSQASISRGLANLLYNCLASWMVGHRVSDLTSGFRAVRRKRFVQFLHMLPNGFSYPATSTIAFFRAGYSVAFEPIVAHPRQGRTSHIRPLKDGLRFLLIIFKIGTLYSPLKVFAPLSLVFFLLGSGYYGYTFASEGRFTNMSALLIITSVVIFLIGLISEQITNLLYRDQEG